MQVPGRRAVQLDGNGDRRASACNIVREKSLRALGSPTPVRGARSTLIGVALIVGDRNNRKILSAPFHGGNNQIAGSADLRKGLRDRTRTRGDIQFRLLDEGYPRWGCTGIGDCY